MRSTPVAEGPAVGKMIDVERRVEPLHLRDGLAHLLEHYGAARVMTALVGAILRPTRHPPPVPESLPNQLRRDIGLDPVEPPQLPDLTPRF